MGFVESFLPAILAVQGGLPPPLLGGYLPIAFRTFRNQRLNSGSRSPLLSRLWWRVSLSTALAISIAWILLILILSTPPVL